MESHKKLPLVYCLSVEMVTPEIGATELSISKQDRLNILLAEQIKTHLDGLELTDTSLKFNGNGWLLMTNSEKDAQVLCCLARIIASTFRDEMAKETGMAAERVPSLHLGVFTSRDRLIELPGGQKEWIGESVRKAGSLLKYCQVNEILVDDQVKDRVSHSFDVRPVNISQRIADGVPAITEATAVSALGELKLDGVLGADSSESLIYTLKATGSVDEAAALTKRLSEKLTANAEKPDAGMVAEDFDFSLHRANRLITSILDYPRALQMLSALKKMEIAANVITYNALIYKAPDYENAHALFEMMIEDGIKADVATYSSLLSKAPDYETAKALHEAMQKESIKPNLVAYNTLVAKSPDYATAKSWVEAMIEDGIQPNISAYGALMAKALEFDKARFWLDTMLEEGIQPNLSVFNRLLSKVPDYDRAKTILQMMLEEGIRSNIITYNNLITKAVDFDTAQSWFDAMKGDGIQPNIDTYNRLFSKNLTGKKAEDVVVWYKGQGLDSEEPIQVAMATYQKMGRIDQALRLAVDYPHLPVAKKLIREIMDAVFSYLETMREEGTRGDINSYNALIAKAPYYETAKSWLDAMKKHGVTPDAATYKVLLMKAPDYITAKSWVEMMQQEGIQPDAESYTSLFSKNLSGTSADEIIAWYKAQKYCPDESILAAITTYKSMGRVDQALRLALEFSGLQLSKDLIKEHLAEVLAYLETVKEEGVKPNVVTYSTLISKAPYYNIAESWLETMNNKGIRPNVVTYNALMSKAPDYETAKSLLDKMQKEGIDATIVTYSTLISKAPDFKTGKALFKEMLEADIEPNVITFNALISKAPDFNTATALFETMKQKGIAASVVTYNMLIHKPCGFDIAKLLVEDMQRSEIQPNIVSYNRLFSKNMSGMPADELIKWYKAQKYHPDEPIQAAIATYRNHGKVDQALRMALEYPHLQVSRKLIREHMNEALSYFKEMHGRGEHHPNTDYALGLAFMEGGKGSEAEPYLKKALNSARSGQSKVVLEECLRKLDPELSKMA